MWLINTTTFLLEEFKDATDLEYAILSHTWGYEEVLFQDMSDPALARKKPGWHKIEKTCDLASALDYSYAWVDSCCINKSSSEELSEAINSMFSYYRQSAVCFAYLDDLQTATESFEKADDLQGGAIRQGLEKCRWFTRGWTLQELIAAENVQFYNASWSFVASKNLIRSQLSEITGIDASILENADNLGDVPVGRRMSWASQRHTTRIEDMAYCLLGIFRIAMPPLYGEGNRAFIRLQEEIARNSNDLTLFAWEQDETKSYQFREIWAHSPLEFRNCARLRVQPLRFEAENEFTLTNRGLRIEKNLNYMEQASSRLPPNRDEHLILGLDCLECSERTENKPQWVAITLERFGSIYVRSSPGRLKYLPCRAAWPRSSMSQKITAYIARSLTPKDLHSLQSKAIISLVFRPGMRPSRERYYAEGTKGADYTEIFEVIAPRNFVTYMPFLDKLWPTIDIARPTVVFGVQGPSNELWAMPFFDDKFREAYRSADVPSAETRLEHLAAVRDYVFENFSDPSGLLARQKMPSHIELRDPTHLSWIHRFTVRVSSGTETPHSMHTLQSNVSIGSFCIVFAHSIIDENEDES